MPGSGLCFAKVISGELQVSVRINLFLSMSELRHSWAKLPKDVEEGSEDSGTPRQAPSQPEMTSKCK